MIHHGRCSLSRTAFRGLCQVCGALAVGATASVGCWATLTPATAGAAGLCPNEQVRIEEPYALALPDCRAYEQISPVEKNYADALGAVTSVNASASGGAVTFDSLGDVPTRRRILRRRVLAVVHHLPEHARARKGG